MPARWLTSMEWLEHVLAVAGAVAQAAQQLDQLVVDAVLTPVSKHGPLALLA